MTFISHAFVLPDNGFADWLDAMHAYRQRFDQVAIVRDVDGTHLSYFSTVSAVEVPGMWAYDDAHYHIRRALPMIAKVDVIRVTTPDALRAELARRIADGDRYGETRNDPQHVYNQFVLDWPTRARPARILHPFLNAPTRKHEGIDITASTGEDVQAGADGVVSQAVPANDALNYGAYVQITSVVDNLAFRTTYAGLIDIAVEVGESVESGQAIGKAAADQIKIVVQRMAGGMHGLKLPNVVDPAEFVYCRGLRLRPNVSALRVRSARGLHGDIIGVIGAADRIESPATHGEILKRVGQRGEWLRVRFAGRRDAFCDASYLDAVSLHDPPEGIAGIAIPGVNLDIHHRLGTPPADVVRSLGWVRLTYNVSYNPALAPDDPLRYGNTDLNATFNRYCDVLEAYASAGIRVILTLTHQTFGEGQGYVWERMDDRSWRGLADRFAAMAGQVAAQMCKRNWVYAYQIWNEQDTPPQHARAAVPVPPAHYGYLLAESIRAIRRHDNQAQIITGGHASGPHSGTAYIREALRGMPAGILPDGVAFHPYGRGVGSGSRFSHFGSIAESIEQWAAILPNKPLWITEWGTLDLDGQDKFAAEVNEYIVGFMNRIYSRYPGQVAAAIWYAWADGMDNGYGLVRQDGTPRQPIYDTFLRDL